MDRLKAKLRQMYYVTGYQIVGWIMWTLGYRFVRYWTEVPEDVTKLSEWKFHLEWIR